MRIYTSVNEVFITGQGWLKPDENGEYDANNATLINYNYVDITITPDKQTTTHIGQEDVPIKFSRECMYADGCRLHPSLFSKKY